MDKIIERGQLFDFYGELLTSHQQKIYSDAVFNDLSLSELSEEQGISRQGIHDLIKRCDKQLSFYEEKLKLIDKFLKIRRDASRIDEIIDCDNGLDEKSRKEIKVLLNQIMESL